MKNIISTILIFFSYITSQGAVYDVTNTTTDNWSGAQPANSLAWALAQANATAGPHSIRLMVAGTVTGGNPANYSITQNNITIDGTYAPGYSSSTGPKFFLKGPAYNTFNITGSNAIIKAFGMSSFSFNVTGASFGMYGCWLGLTSAGALDGTAPGPSYGISITGGSARIGYNSTGNGNVISYSGVTNVLSMSGSSNYIVGNYFMTESTGTSVIGTVGTSVTGSVILIQGNNNTVDSNVVLGSCGGGNFGGIAINGSSSNLRIANNKIGVNKNGTFASSGGTAIYGNNGHGIYSSGSISSSLITNNVISANKQSGISIEQNSTSLTISDNTVGLPGSGIQGSVYYGNGDSGIRFYGATATSALIDNNTVCNSGLNNSSGNQATTTGIIFNSVTVASATISNNYTGVDRSYNLAGNQFPGIYFFTCGNMGGSDVTKVVISNNVVGNNGLGVTQSPPSNGISCASSNYFTITGNYIGIGTSGQNIGNVSNGIEINTCNHFVITNNNIQYNQGKRTSAVADACAGIMCFASSIGTIQGNTASNQSNASGYALNNGIVVQQGGQILIGGTSAGQPNTIENNGTHGVFVYDNANYVQITRNVIACNASMGISLNMSGDPNTVGAKSVGNSAMAVNPLPTVALPGSGCPGTGGNSSTGSVTFTGTAQANSTVEVFQNPQSCRDCATQGTRRGEGLAYLSTVTADGSGNFTYGPVSFSGDIAVTSTSTTSCNGGYCSTSRFSSCSTCSLPVKWYYLKALWDGISAQVKWVTSSEKNAGYFIVERSLDGRNFEPISEPIKATGNSNTFQSYVFNDENAFTGSFYYRIHEVDINGLTDYSTVVFLDLEDGTDISISPNPNRGNFSINLNAKNEKNVFVTIKDVTGKVVYNNAFDTNQGFLNEDLKLSELSSGLYFVTVSGNDFNSTTKLVIE